MKILQKMADMFSNKAGSEEGFSLAFFSPKIDQKEVANFAKYGEREKEETELERDLRLNQEEVERNKQQSNTVEQALKRQAQIAAVLGMGK